MRRALLSNLLATTILFLIISFNSFAQFPYTESFLNTTAPGMVISGSAKLTAATGTDPVGQGYLRLTDNSISNVGYAYCQQAFPSNYGITASFEFFMWKSDAAGWNQADGISFFLFDASVNSFRPGGTGGSLGYAQYYSVPGMAKGYMGISIDGFGNFSSATDGTKNGGPGQRRGSIAIRGPGNGSAVTDYVYQTGVIASDPAYNAGFMNFTQRYPASTSSNYRKIDIVLTPGSSLGASIGYTVTVRMIKGGSPTTAVTLINNYDYPFAAPSQLKFGLAGSTGALSNYQEIRNMTINVTNTGSLLSPVLLPDVAVVCQGQPTIIDVTANDVSSNTGGTINKASVDLDPLTAGKQTSYTDIGKGSYSVDSTGIVTFTPQVGFTGISAINYKVDDTYGAAALASNTITVTASALTAPVLTINNPPAVCSPAAVNIADPLYKSATSIGASYDYFNSLNNANNNTGNINASAGSLTVPGTYYIRASLAGCATVKPIVVQINQAPTTSNAGPDQTFCSSAGGLNATLLANNPATGVGTWTQVSGPVTANINFTNASTTPVINMDKGIYVFRWTVANGACAASSDDVQLTVGVPSNAGTTQTICNATTATLAGSAPAPGVGLWTKVSGPTMSFANTALAGTGITGLTPGNSYVFSWKVTNGSCINTSNVTITNVLNTIADAGLDQSLSLATGISLSGNTPDVGNTGVWTLVSGPAGNTVVIDQPSNRNSTVSNLTKKGDYYFRWTMTNSGFSNYDDVRVSLLSILPVRLVSFTGQEQNGLVTLNWKTASEENNDHFEIERSSDGVNFSIINMMPGKGNTSTITEYSYQDNIAALNGSVFYYRLRQVDIDKKSTLSPVVKITVPVTCQTKIYPNPFKDNLQIDFNSLTEGKGTVFVYSVSGQLFKKELITVAKGLNKLSIKNLGNLPKGLVTIRVELDNNKFTLSTFKD